MRPGQAVPGRPLSVPELPRDCDSLSAALAYAAAGWYVVPVRRGSKNPGSVLGKAWDEKSMRDPDEITARWAGTHHGVALHAGRSGAVIFDVDRPARMHAELTRAIVTLRPPHQSTRVDAAGRGHYLFALPPGATLGNGTGRLGGEWGEVRGTNGVIVVAPSVHEYAETGGRYSWQRTGLVPELPGYLRELLPDPIASGDAADDEVVAAFLAKQQLPAGDPHDLIGGHLRAWDAQVRRGESRHQAMTGHLAGLMREAAAGMVDAQVAVDAVGPLFVKAVTTGSGARDLPMAQAEWDRLLAWAIGQAEQADPEATRARVAGRGADAPAALVLRGATDLNSTGVPVEVEPITRAEAHAAFRKWMGPEYDTAALDAVAAAVAVERLDGDPLWLLVVSGAGAGKTETVAAAKGAGALIASTITGEAALLSATAKKDVAKDATGGLLRELGKHGMLVLKDFTSILSMNRDRRAEVLAALREVYDGEWSRKVGVDGGRSIPWAGRIGLVGATTTAYDAAHSVIAACGDRFALVRISSGHGSARRAYGRQALLNVGREVDMRGELAEAFGRWLAGTDPARAVLRPGIAGQILDVADLVSLTRTAIERDHQGNVEWSHDAEMPTRLGKMLAQVIRGALAVGCTVDEAEALMVRVARDTMPPLRLDLLETVARLQPCTCSQVTKAAQRPRTTVDRTLQELHALGLLVIDESTMPGTGWLYRLAAGVDLTVLTPVPSPVLSNQSRRANKEASGAPPDGLTGGLDISGEGPLPRPKCGACGTVLHNGAECLRCRFQGVPA